MCEQKLLKDIEEHREQMINLATRTSFSHPKVIDLSAKLDVLLNKYDSFMKASWKENY
ncbi:MULTISPECIES: aspartyl-phosphate phosphatase Spo0E family protein [Bacillaceae]|uniref:aspartyl-phosphate phosphatase Spo0E family protein n=1 Tax=Bacillaceae TaxID=186817 RepID=UPI00177B573F|nr:MULTISPECIES: aspartyl-phosphate phosphatase Spo0E family protein [Bacillaceae]MBE0317772.1 aspartyl-phosphate phosphatase Spo0E family protein [Xanthomonas citri pv. punicae]MCE4050562.1 aspartyl-phosphate phosphatase Spo0E family protein [Bacillus sp. Au-Bac7]MCM3034282.1 aspartyl-phosphate phosphatase Spo0E family protein [Niallia sp. MER 6]MDL0435957.1 aspartyl-phosphate phosphatase Spo0E family protein [Niallia sp. SS-2023]UPO87827.1 aspartyl-phosphate phosphatase Spo0E family protein 